MSSFMKMFKNKKGGNKENLPQISRSSLERSSSRSVDGVCEKDVYSNDLQRNQEIQLSNPYSIVTAPKKTKGPRSCPDSSMDQRNYRNSSAYPPKPFNNRYSVVNNSLRYDSIGGSRMGHVPEKIPEYGSESGTPDLQNRNRSTSNHVRRSRFYGRMPDSTDEDDDASLQILHLEGKLKRAKELLRVNRREMSERIEELHDDLERIRRDYDTLKWHFNRARETIEDQAKINAKQERKLRQALSEVTRLKSMLAEHSNDSSFLIPYGGGLPPLGYIAGAGEALCSLVDTQTEIGSSSNPSISLQNENEDDADMQDEVRVFRTAECETPPPERPRAAESPVEPPSSFVPMPDFGIRSGIVPQRSMSDTDIHSLIQREEQKNDFEKEIYRKKEGQSLLKDLYLREHESGKSSGSSDEETYRVFEKQLKKRGDVVKFQPPRISIHPKHYRRFGKMERSALAEFEYLQDISTDVSGMMSSPETNNIIGVG